MISAQSALGTDFYVDATLGLDENTGLTETQAWKTLHNVNAGTFQPGDNIYFKRGEVWREQLTISDSGNVSSTILFGAYGEDPDDPLIKRTEMFADWWLDSLIRNGGMEDFAEGSPSDDFADFSGETRSNTNCHIQADDAESHSGTYSARMKCATDSKPFSGKNHAKIFKALKHVNQNDEYYLSAWSKSGASSNPLALRIEYTTKLEGTRYRNQAGQWKTSPTVHLTPWINAPANQWSEAIVDIKIPSATEAGVLKITFYQWSDVELWLDDLYLAEGGPLDEGEPTVWAGTIQGVENYYGAVNAGNQRLEVALADPLYQENYDPALISKNIFSKLLNHRRFYFRNDSLSPPDAIEVGARKHGILIDGESHIDLENLTLWGPGAKIHKNDDLEQLALLAISNDATHISLHNIEISHSNSIGFFSEPSASNIHLDSVDAHNNGSTGIYLKGSNNSIRNSSVHHNGNNATDSGDRGGIGCNTNCRNLLITGNEVYSNARIGVNGDQEISIVSPDGPVTITQNFVHDCLTGCIQISNGGSDSVISYNIIAGYGENTGMMASSEGHWSGLRIGAGGGVDETTANVKIFNNIITGGQQPISQADCRLPAICPETHAGIFIGRWNTTGTTIKNNIIFGNLGTTIYIKNSAWGAPVIAGYDFDNNIYETSSTDAKLVWKSQKYASLDAWRSALQSDGMVSWDANTVDDDPLFFDANNFDFRPLNHTSPAWNKGAIIPIDQNDADFDGNPITATPDIGAHELMSFTISETTLLGSRDSTDYLNTHASDDLYQNLTEETHKGRSQLEHIWTFDIKGHNSATLHAEAFHTLNDENDFFTFAYSTDGTNFTDMSLNVSKTRDDDAWQSEEINGLSGASLYIKVRDSGRKGGEKDLDTLSIDLLHVELK